MADCGNYNDEFFMLYLVYNTIGTGTKAVELFLAMK